MITKHTRLLFGFVTALVLLISLIGGVAAPVYAATLVDCPDGTTVPMSGNQTVASVCHKAPDTPCTPAQASSATSGCCSIPGSNQCISATKCPQDHPLCADSASQATNCDQNGCDLISNYVNKAINLVSVLVGLVVVASIIVGAIQYSSAGGDPQKVANARNRIRNSILALVGYVLLYSFLQFLIPGGLLHK